MLTQINFQDTQIAFERKSDADLRRMDFLFRMMSRPWLVNVGSNLTLLALKLHLPVQGIIKRTIFQQFCGGTSLEESLPTIEALDKYGVKTVLDYGAEAKESEADFDKTMGINLQAIKFAGRGQAVPIVSCKVTGLARFALLEKLNAHQPLNADEEQQYARLVQRLEMICAEAAGQKISLFIDAEESWIQDAIDRLTNEMMERFNRERATIYNTFQMYRHDRLEFLKKSLADARAKGYILGAKLVRGAYMEKERARAEEMGYPSPIQKDKAATDADYNAAVTFCADNIGAVACCVASHNEQSTRLGMELAESKGIEKSSPLWSFCQLYGMSDNLTFNLAKAGYRSSKYMPYGSIRDVIPYLIRRAKENSSVNGEVGRELSLIRQELQRRKGKR